MILGRKHLPGVEAHPHRDGMSVKFSHGRGELVAGALGSILDVMDIAGMAIGEAKVHTLSRRIVKFIGRDIVTQPIVPGIGKP